MSGFKRPSLWSTGIVLLLLAGLALYTYFVGTRTLLEYAEGFAFRRMTVNQLPEEGAYRFFYTTNRVQGVEK